MAKLRQNLIEKSYRIYVTDCLRSFIAGLSSHAPYRWLDTIDPPPEETRTPEEIIEQVRQALND